MPTFLNLCQDVARDVNTGGVLSTVVGQIGLFKKLVQFVAQADYDIQSSVGNWKFLHREWDLTLVQDQAVYSPPDNIGNFDPTSFWINPGTSTAQPMVYSDYKAWRDNLRHAFIDSGTPFSISFYPDNRAIIIPAPCVDCAGSVVVGDYWMSPVKMVNDNDVSLIPEQYHGVISALAKMYFAENRHDTGWYNSAFVRYTKLLAALKSSQLPGWEDDNRSESSVPLIIEVQ